MAGPYDPVGECIYCGAKVHSKDRQRLGDEHIIPEGLGGELILPKASCGKCEGMTNASEHFCQKDMLGAFRYQLGLPSKRPKERPKTLKATVIEGEKERTIDVPVGDFPVCLLVPIFPAPKLLLPHPEQRSDLFVTHTHPKLSMVGEDFKLWLKGAGPRFQGSFVRDGVRYSTGTTDTLRFGRMIAKIAHSFATAELGLGTFWPILKDSIHLKSKFAHDFLVGGDSTVPPPAKERHILSIEDRIVRGRKMWVVNVRLFADLGFPQYQCVAGIDRNESRNLPLKMLLAGPLSMKTYSQVTPLASRGNPIFESDLPADLLCALCSDVIGAGALIPDDVVVQCGKCHTWNVTEKMTYPWGIPYSSPELPAPDDPRANWIKSS